MPPHLRSEPLSPVDAAWLHMDSPTNMMMITGVMMLGQPVDMRRLLATYEHRWVGRFPRFRMRIRHRGLFGVPYWEEDPNFDLASHVHRIALPAPGDQAVLQEVVGDLMSTPLDYEKPPWQVHVIDNFGSGCAVITRLSHAFGDGIAMMHVVLTLADTNADAPWPEPAVPEDEYRPPLLTRIVVPAMTALDSTLRLGDTVVHEGMETLVNVAKAGAGATQALGKLLFLPPDHKTIFKQRCGRTKRAAWTQPMPLADVKAVGKLLCGTINDVLLASVTGGLRRYLAGRCEATAGLNIRALIPVNLRPCEDLGTSLGNRFGLIYLSLPVGLEDPMERLRELKRRMDEIKRSPEALVVFDILNAIGSTPENLERLILPFFSGKASAVMTNVPGPRQQLYCAGAPVDGFMFWVPQSVDLGLGVSILSYNGMVIIGVATDAGIVPDPEKIAAAIEAEFGEMQDYVRFVREDEANGEDIGLPLEAASTSPGVPGVGHRVQPLRAGAPAGNNGQANVAAATVYAGEMQAAPAPAAGATLALPGSPSGTFADAQRLERCQAMTKSGQPCQNRSLPGTTLCRVHTPKAA